jgi:hypothetical protein
MVMAVFLFMNALSSALAEVLTPAITDPHLIWVWAGPAIALFIQTCIFWWRYRWMNSDAFMTADAVQVADDVPATKNEETLEPIDSKVQSSNVGAEKEIKL